VAKVRIQWHSEGEAFKVLKLVEISIVITLGLVEDE
jgi:hypothetical protein